MRNASKINDVVERLRSVSPDGNATLAELGALVDAQSSLDDLIRDCLEQLRSRPTAEARAHRVDRASAWSGDADALQVARFWEAFSSLLAWDFVPTDFLHALYLDWRPGDEAGANTNALTAAAFARRINLAASADGAWTYARMRGSRRTMGAHEPLLERVAWDVPTDGRARYGLRRR